MKTVRIDALGEGRPLDLTAEGREVIDLLLVGGRTLYVDGGHFLRSHGIGTERHVHTGVTGTDYHDSPADPGVFAVVDALQEVQALDQPFVAGERNHHRIMGTAGDDQCVILFLQLFEELRRQFSARSGYPLPFP